MRAARFILVDAAVVAALFMAVPTPAHAFIYAGKKWPSTTVRYIQSAALTTAEKSYVTACATAWNNGPSAWTLTATTSSGVYNTYSKTDFSYQGWPDIPGITTVTASNGVVSKCQSYFNTDFSWNNSGVMDKTARKCDYKTVILHEFGHWIVLKEDSCHTGAVMWPNWTAKQSLTTTDKNGLDYVY